VAIDPKNPDVNYAGTWHLAWKTDDGGRNWHQINRGMIDDSDVFSIIVDPKEPNLVFASACSGIYKSQTAGELFHKVPGIPFSSRRTRVLKQDPNHPNIVYAGTTEGLWRTEDYGTNWKRISSANVIVNDVLLFASEPNLVLLATDRIGVLMSTNRAQTFSASNRGFTHRQVSSVLVDSKNSNRIYASTLNDRETGGVFVSDDAGKQWQQMSAGLGGHDVFQVRQDDQSNLYAATNGGLFRYSSKSRLWMKVLPARMETRLRVSDVDLTGSTWFIATAEGLYSSKNHGASWAPVAGPGKQPIIAVRSNAGVTAAATYGKVYVSTNGNSWDQIHIPLVSYISSMTLDAKGYLWLNSPQGVFRQVSDGWEKARELPQEKIASLDFDRRTASLVAITRDANLVLVSNDGRKWSSVYNAGVPVRAVAFSNDRMFAGTIFDCVVPVSLDSNKRMSASSEPGGGN
jgi:ligand-binding sensor domain-containing protein